MLYDVTPNRLCGRARGIIWHALWDVGVKSKVTSSADVLGLRVLVLVDHEHLDKARGHLAAVFGRSYGPIRIFCEARE